MRAAAVTACFTTLLLAFAAPGIRADESAHADAPAPAAAVPVEVLLHTQAGDIVITLDAEHAPLTTANFLRYVDQRRYDGAEFYRAVRVDDDGHYGLLQGGLHRNRTKTLEPVTHESPAVTGLHHVDGAVSMARNEPGSATSEFFIVLGDLTSLDGEDGDPGYAVFGHVASGMELVHQMLGLPRSADAGSVSMRGQMLAEPVKILTARRISAADRLSGGP